MVRLFFLLLSFVLCNLYTKVEASSFKGKLRLKYYCLNDIETGEERYNVLLKVHKDAIEKGFSVDYNGIDTINITIPNGAESIPLSAENDFAGVVFNVTNNGNDIFLFSFINKANAIDVSASSIDRGRFTEYPQLAHGNKLLAIEDKTPWVKNRMGYKYGHVRKDILLLKNGKAKNIPIMPYDNKDSSPSCVYYNLNESDKISISNLTLTRTAVSISETYLCNIIGINNVSLQNITINTPKSDKVNDVAILINDCTNINFENVTINDTYSREDYSGYGIVLGNVWHFKANHLKCSANWGVFGNNNINTAIVENSDINRFDVHCYGRNIVFKNCIFRNLYNQFSSVYGKIEFSDCDFMDFTPVLFEPSYNAYVKLDLKFKNCRIYSSREHNYLIYAVGLTGDCTGERKELRRQEYPNLYINGLSVIGEYPYYFYLFERGLLQWPEDSILGVRQIKRVKFVNVAGNEKQIISSDLHYH